MFLRKIVALAILYFFKAALSLRYRVTIKGLEHLTKENLNKKGGVLFLPNHPTVFVDPTLVTLAVFRKFPIRPIVVEYMYYTPGIHWMMRFLRALPIPSFKYTSNSLKRKRSERVLDQVCNDLKCGQNFLIYPSGRVKLSNYEAIGGSSGVHNILQKVPEANVVLVRTDGLYGSIFSTAIDGNVPFMFPMIWKGIKMGIKNLIFFTPRRDVRIEFMPAPADFPAQGSRLEMNQWLEHFYNKPLEDFIARRDNGNYPGEPLKLVSYSLWSEELPKIKEDDQDGGAIEMDKVPDRVKLKVIEKIAELSKRDPSEIEFTDHLSSDLGMDSLDGAELLVFLEDEFGIVGVPTKELTTVKRLIGIAAKQVKVESDEPEVEFTNLKKWSQPIQETERCHLEEGQTIPEIFLNNTFKRSGKIACGDERAGVLTNGAVRMRALLLAEYIRKLPGKQIGILLPSSVAATVTILACQIAGKVPVMINWTVGPRHLASVVEFSGLKKILTSWAFLEKLENIDLDIVEDLLIFLEEARGEFTLGDKLKAVWRARQPTQAVMKTFGVDTLQPNDPAVILFTSGTENVPKGVPLTHANIISNQSASLKRLEMNTQDIFFAILPPFHAFGFTVGSLIPLLSGIRVAFYPDPTDGRKLAAGIKKWGITAVCGAPTFLKGMLKAAATEELKTLRYCVSGAEKAPPELYVLARKHGIEEAMLEGYGITECSPVLTLNHHGEEQVGVGAPVEGVELLVVDLDTRKPLKTRERGLILCRGPNVFHGYLNPGLKSPFVEVDGREWYNTGDLGYLDEKNRLTLAGRLKRFVKIGGEMISLAAIENALLDQASQCGWELAEDSPSLAVVAQEKENAKPEIFLFTTFETNLEEVNRALRNVGFSNLVKVTEHKRLSEIPIMGSGKVFYRDLQERFLTTEKNTVNV